ncbi:hypothetical protein PFISCL1PPCAC_14023, partial [Pristionchus fissidentatus]
APILYADIDVSTIAKMTIGLNSLFTIASVIFLNSEVSLYWESFSENFQRNVLQQNNFTNPLTITQMLSFSRPDSPYFEKVGAENKHMLIEYGTTWGNWCWNDPLPLSGMPSILRSLEFHSVSQFLLRFTFLWSLSVRPIVAFLRAAAVLQRLSTSSSLTSSSNSLKSSNPLFTSPKRRVSLFNLSIFFASPLISFAVLIAGYFITAWQQDLDFHSAMWVPFYAFAGLYSVHMVCYTAIEMMEPTRMVQSRVLARFILTSLFAVTSMTVLNSHVQFLERKTCHVLGESTIIVAHPQQTELHQASAALAEYACALTITIFSLLEWTDVWQLKIVVEDNGIDVTEIDE